MYAMIAGGGKVGYYLARTLVEHGHEVLLIEKNPVRYGLLVEQLGEDAVALGDAADVAVLEAAGAGRADVVISVTGHDEDNIIICQVAKRKFGCRRVVARVNNPRNEETFRMLGIDTTVSSTRIIQGLIEEEVDTADMVPLLALRKGDLQIVEMKLCEKCPAADRHVVELSLPKDCILLSVVRGDEVFIPRGNTVLKAGDVILALAKSESVGALRAAVLVDEARAAAAGDTAAGGTAGNAGKGAGAQKMSLLQPSGSSGDDRSR